MKNKQELLKALAACATWTLLSIPLLASAQQNGIKRVELQRHDLNIPGQEAVQVRIDFSQGTEFARHTHPGEEIIYVLEGALEYRVAGKKPVTLKAGDILFIPAGIVHSAKNVGVTIAKELATYIVEKGKPIVKLVDK